MLEIILMLLGLAFPNSNANTVTTDNQIVQTIITTTSDDGGDNETKGNTGQTPPPTP